MAPQRQTPTTTAGPVLRSTRVQETNTATDTAAEHQTQKPQVAKKSVAKRGASKSTQRDPANTVASNAKTGKRTKAGKGQSKAALDKKLDPRPEEQLRKNTSANEGETSSQHERQPPVAVDDERTRRLRRRRAAKELEEHAPAAVVGQESRKRKRKRGEQEPEEQLQENPTPNEDEAGKSERERGEQDQPTRPSKKRARLEIESPTEETPMDAVVDPSNGEKAEPPRAAATQTQDLGDSEWPTLEQRVVSVNAVADPSNGEQAESPRAAATPHWAGKIRLSTNRRWWWQAKTKPSTKSLTSISPPRLKSQNLKDSERPNPEQKMVSADSESLCAALEQWSSIEPRVQRVQAVRTAFVQLSEQLPEAQTASSVHNHSPVAIETEHSQQPSNSPGLRDVESELINTPTAIETKPDQQSTHPSEGQSIDRTLIPDQAHESLDRTEETSNAEKLSIDRKGVPAGQVRLVTPTAEPEEITKSATEAANHDHISDISDSKEHDLLSAVMLLALANRGLGYELETVEYYKGGRLGLEDRIRGIEWGEQGAVESRLPGLKLDLKVWNEDLDHYYSRVEVMKERVVSACRNLDDVEAKSSSDAPSGGKETELAMQCLAEIGFWTDIGGYRCAKSSAEAIAEELDAVKQEQSAISERTALLGRHFLDFRLKHGMSKDTADPEDISPWYMPDLLLATELAEQERNLERTLQTCFGLEQAQTVAISSERALIGAGLLREREASDTDQVGFNGIIGEAPISHDGDATPSRNYLFDQLRTDLREAGNEFIAAAEMFASEEYRVLTQDELGNLPRPVSEDDKGVALFKKLQEHTRVFTAVNAKYQDVLQRARLAGITAPATAQDDTTSHFSLAGSEHVSLPPSLKAHIKAKAQPIVDRWKAYGQGQETPPLASGKQEAFVSAVPANDKSLRSISVGHTLPDAGSNFSNRIAEMRRRTDQLRSLKQGELGPGNCNGRKMPKRPFDTAENDFSPSKRRRTDDVRSLERGELGPGDCDGRKMPKRPFDHAANDSPPAKRRRTDGPGDRNDGKRLERPLDNTENDAENDCPPSKRAREDHNTSQSQQTAEDARGDPMDVDDPDDHANIWTTPRPQLPPGSWNDNGYDGGNSDEYWSTQTLQAIQDSRYDYTLDCYDDEDWDVIE
jgi:hypothetical protein